MGPGQRVRLRSIAAVCLGVLLTMPAAATAPSEHDLKAAYVFNILRFIEKRAVGKPGEFLTLGVHAAGPIESSLRALEGTPVRGSKLRIQRVEQDSDVRGCEVVFFGRSHGKSAQSIHSAAAQAGVLTIGNDAEFLPAGGMIALVVESRKVIIELNLEAIVATGWVASSHLLEMARIVKGAGQ
jgi:hypothetical protein